MKNWVAEGIASDVNDFSPRVPMPHLSLHKTQSQQQKYNVTLSSKSD